MSIAVTSTACSPAPENSVFSARGLHNGKRTPSSAAFASGSSSLAASQK
jgi:hypothetical protein